MVWSVCEIETQSLDIKLKHMFDEILLQKISVRYARDWLMIAIFTVLSDRFAPLGCWLAQMKLNRLMPY